MEAMKQSRVVDPMWRQVSAFLGVMFFIFMADASLADFVPGYMQEILGSPLKMGIVMSSSSIAGLALDLLFARVLRKTNVRLMLILAISGSVGFSLALLSSTFWPYAWILILGMVIWGLYYEFFGFASQKFIVSIATPGKRTAVWSVLETIRCIAYGLGPLMMAWFVRYGNSTVILASLGITFVSFLLFLLVPIRERAADLTEHPKITVWHELSHWRVLFVHIWPIVAMGLLLGVVDSMYWTTGTIVNDTLALQHPAGALFLTVYMLSAIVVGFVLGRSMLRSGKKKLANIFILLSGFVLSSITFSPSVWWILLIVFVSSALNGLAWPLLDAVYTDLMDRMGREQVHMMGLRSASYSLAFVVGPIFCGWLATEVGELSSFVYMGWIMVAVSLTLLMVTPRKLNLPQQQIQTWE
jgi:MFS family permease